MFGKRDRGQVYICCCWNSVVSALWKKYLPQTLVLTCLSIHCIVKTVEERFFSHLF